MAKRTSITTDLLRCKARLCTVVPEAVAVDLIEKLVAKLQAEQQAEVDIDALNRTMAPGEAFDALFN
jgi:hypothetical protein